MNRNYENPFEMDRTEKDVVFFTEGNIRTMKFNCSDGEFLKLGKKKGEGITEMKIQVIKHMALPPGKMYQTKEPTDWHIIFYVDEDGILCESLLKGESRDNFLETVGELYAKSNGTKNFTDYTLIARMNDRHSAEHKSDYYAVTFEPVEIDAASLERNKNFAADHYQDVYSNRVVLEFLEQNSSNFNTMKANGTLHEVVAEMNYRLGMYPEEKKNHLLSMSGGGDAAILELEKSIEA